jgi:hypothetical protein
MNKSLFQIEKELLLIEQQLEESGGELTPEIEQALEIGQQELQSKAFNYCKFIGSLEADISKAKSYKAQIDGYIKKKENLLNRLKNALKNAVLNFGSFEAEIFTLSTRKSESLEIIDENLVPDKYKTIKQTITIDKKLIKSDLKNQNIAGVVLNKNINLQIK